MDFLSKFFAKKEPDHAVIVHFHSDQADLQPLFDLEDQLIVAIEAAGVGVFDGNELAADGSDGYLYMYGPDAGLLFDTIQPILAASEFMKGASVKLRYGPPGKTVKEIETQI
jgi:hypothetical protein